jgi:hypothetical protein
MKSRTRFAHRVDMWDGDGEYIIDQLAPVEDFLLPSRLSCGVPTLPDGTITLRQGARVAEDSRRTRIAKH